MATISIKYGKDGASFWMALITSSLCQGSPLNVPVSWAILFTPPLIPAGIHWNPGIPAEWTGFWMDSYPFCRNSKEKLHYTKQINHIQKKLP